MARLFPHCFPDSPGTTECRRAYSILVAAHDSASSFLDVYQTKQQIPSSDEAQDLLRAMLMFSASGLDSMIKQLFRDALPAVVEKHPGARIQLREFLVRSLKKKEPCDFDLMAQMLLEGAPRQRVVDGLVAEITSSSLQSSEQVLRAAAYFDIPSAVLSADTKLLQEIFRRRNQMAHEMDVDFSEPNRHRRQRDKDGMVADTTQLFQLSKLFLQQVDARVQGQTQSP